MKYSFIDVNGNEQTIDSERMGCKAYNADCMELLKKKIGRAHV